MSYIPPYPAGQDIMANSMPVVIASDQSALAVTGTFWQATQPISAASLPLPTGASTSANQTTLIGHVDGIEALLTTIDADTSILVSAIGQEDAASGADPFGQILVGRYRDEENPLSAEVITAGDWVTLNATSKGELYVKHKDGLVISSGNMTIANGAYARDLASGAFDPGLAIMGVRNDSAASSFTGSNGDYSPIAVNVNGRVFTSATIENTSLTVAQATASSLKNEPAGNVAHDAADSGNPIKVGAKAVSSLASATMVAAADRTDNVSDLDGTLITRINFPFGDLKSDATSNTDGNSTASSVFTGVASTRNYITGIHVFRTDAGTTPIYIDFRDGTAGSVLWRMVLPPNGGSVIANSGVPIFRTTANTALAYDVSAATSTVYINVTGFQSKA